MLMASEEIATKNAREILINKYMDKDFLYIQYKKAERLNNNEAMTVSLNLEANVEYLCIVAGDEEVYNISLNVFKDKTFNMTNNSVRHTGYQMSMIFKPKESSKD
jgi:hypothetical protein